MDSKLEKLPKSKIKFQIKAGAADIAHFFDMAVEKLSKELKLPGFRPGKIPADVARGALDPHILEHEAQDIAINDTYLQLVTGEKLIPVARPENVKIVFFNEMEGLEWEGEVDVLPSINIEGWQNKLKVKSSNLPAGRQGLKVEEFKVEEKEIEDTINGLQKQFANVEDKDPADGGVKVETEKGDWVNLDIDVVDKDRFAPEIANRFLSRGFTLVIGEANFIPGFEEELMGIEKGDEKEFDLTFPENYHEKSLQNQKVKFKVKINDIKKIILPELNDVFSKNFGFEKIDDLKKAISEDIFKRKEGMAKAKYEDDVLKNLIDGISIDLPDSLIEQEKDMIMKRFVHDLEHHKGVKFADYLLSLGKKEEDLRNGFSIQAEYNVKTGLVIGQIAREEKMEINDRDIEEVMSMDIINQTAGLPPEKAQEFEDKIKERYKDEEFLESIKNSILARKTIDLIVNQVNSK